jgi:hypothetical protein
VLPPVEHLSRPRPIGELEMAVHQVAVGDGRREWRVCKCTDPAMRLVPFLRALTGVAGVPVPVARQVGGALHAGR